MRTEGENKVNRRHRRIDQLRYLISLGIPVRLCDYENKTTIGVGAVKRYEVDEAHKQPGYYVKTRTGLVQIPIDSVRGIYKKGNLIDILIGKHKSEILERV